MAVTPEGMYQQLGALVAAMPVLTGRIGAEEHRWLGRAAVLLRHYLSPVEVTSFNLASESLFGMLQEQNALKISAMVHRALAHAEQAAPADMQGQFIAAGAAFTALQVISKILSPATDDLLIIDPYLDATVMFEFVPLAPERVNCRLLGSNREVRTDSLRTGLTRWRTQFGETRPIEARVVPQRQLHDRIVIIDRRTAFNLSQSLNAFAATAHASAVRFPEDIARQKIDAYSDMWDTATVLA